MEILQKNVEFKITDVKFDGSTERLTIKMQPLNSARYLETMHISFHYKHDYSDYKYYRRFLSNNNFTSTDVNNLIDKKFRGSIARFKRSDGSEFNGPYSSSLQLIMDASPVAPKIKLVVKKIKPNANKVATTMSNKSKQNPKQMAAEVLSATGSLHYKIIWDEIAKRGYISNGKTPWETIGAHLYMDIKKNGNKSIFVQTAPATFALRTKLIVPTQTSIIENAPIVTQERKSVAVLETPTLSISSILSGIKNTIQSLFQI